MNLHILLSSFFLIFDVSESMKGSCNCDTYYICTKVLLPLNPDFCTVKIRLSFVNFQATISDKSGCDFSGFGYLWEVTIRVRVGSGWVKFVGSRSGFGFSVKKNRHFWFLGLFG